MSKRISRTRAEILEGVELYRGKYVLQTCSNCGGQGTYPSSMTPSGMCRLYCWQNRTPETYGKEIIPVDKYVARAQAADRREARREEAQSSGRSGTYRPPPRTGQLGPQSERWSSASAFGRAALRRQG